MIAINQAGFIDTAVSAVKNQVMRRSLPAVLLGVSLAIGCAATLPVRSASAATPQAEFYPRPAFFQLSGTCTMDVSPDQALIVGGRFQLRFAGRKTPSRNSTSSSASMRGYFSEKHGELLLMERVRTLKNPQPGREDNEPPFQVVQRLQVKLPANAPVDAILQKLIELGLDRFGDNVMNVSNRREAVIRFRVSDLDAKLKDMQQRCTAGAWKQFCGTPASNGICTSDTPPADLELQVFNVRSKESLMRPDGATAPWQLNISTRTAHDRPARPSRQCDRPS